MGRFTGLVVMAVFGLALAGCAKKPFDGPTVDAFNGKLTSDGKPVTFSPGENVTLQVIHQSSGQSFGVPIKPDGTFQIGWMPTGKYSALLKREPRSGARGGPSMYNVPNGFAIQDGQTEYTIDLGKGFKP